METKYSPKNLTVLAEEHKKTGRYPSVYNVRKCPVCDGAIYGMPGGRDAICQECGYKDPCCSD